MPGITTVNLYGSIECNCASFLAWKSFMHLITETGKWERQMRRELKSYMERSRQEYNLFESVAKYGTWRWIVPCTRKRPEFH